MSRAMGRWSTAGVLLLASSLGCSATTGVPPAATALEIRTYALPSGLRIVVERDDAARLVGMVWVVDAGAADDPPGKQGLAHLIEHLVLGLPDETGVFTWKRLADLGAAGINGRTSPERTEVYAFARPQALDELAAILLARAGNPLGGAGEEPLARERRIVGEEIALGRENPVAEGRRLLVSALTSGGRRFFPSPAELQAALPGLSLADVRAFVGRWYRPERMTLVLSGAIPPHWEKRLLGMLPESLVGRASEPRAAVRRPLAAVEAAASEGRTGIETVAASAGARELWLGWRLPPARGAAEVPLWVLGQVVNRALRYGVDRQRLGGVITAEASAVSTGLGGALLCRLVLQPSADPAQVREEVSSLLAQIADLPLGDFRSSVERPLRFALQEAVLSSALGLEDLGYRMLMRAELAHYDANASVSGAIEATAKLSPSVISELAAAHLLERPYRSVLLVPRAGRAGGEARRLPPALTLANLDSADAEHGGAPRSPDLDGDDPPPAASEIASVAQVPGASATVVTRMANGLTVMVLRRPGMPFTSMLLGFHAEPRAGEVLGARMAAIHAMVPDLVRPPLERGVLWRAMLDRDGLREILRMYSSSSDEGLELLRDETSTLQVHRTEGELDRWVARAAEEEERTPRERARRACWAALTGGHVYGAIPTADAFRRATPDQIGRWIERVRRPANGVLVVVGDVDARAMSDRVERALGRWRGDPSPPPSPPPPLRAPPPDERRAMPVLSLPDPQRSLAYVSLGCRLPPVGAPRDGLPGTLLAQVIKDDLFRRLRNEMGATYSPNVRALWLRGGTSVLEGHLDVESKALPSALEVLHGWLDPAGRGTVDPTTFERARWRLARQSGLRISTNGDMAHALFAAWNMGWPPAAIDDYPRDLAALTPADVTATLAACRASAVISVVGPGSD